MASARASAARSLVSRHGKGTLCTICRKKDGYPFGSVVLYALDEQGQPFFVFSSIAVHSKNIQDDPRATLLVAEEAEEEATMAAARANLLGTLSVVDDDADAELRASFLEAHPSAEEWMGYGDFHIYKMEIADVYWVGGFGQAGWVSASDYKTASPAEPES
jgi:heme iron utilization protein